MADVVLNSLGVNTWENSFSCVGANGRLVTFGGLTGDGEFKFPVAAAVDSSERVYVVDDHGSKRIQVFFWKIDTGGNGGPGGGNNTPH